MIGTLFNSVQAVFLIMLMAIVGFVFGKLGFIKSDNKKVISKLLMNIAVPCMCITNIFSQFSRDKLFEMGSLIFIPFLGVIITLALSLIAAKVLKLDKRRKGGFIAMCSFSNAMFVGLPMCKELFGDGAVPAVMFYYLINSTLFWTIGNTYIQKSGEVAKDADFKKTLKAVMSPPLVTMLCAIVLLLLDFKMPEIVLKFAGYFGSTVTPLALIYIGFVMFETGLRNIKFDKSYIFVIIMRFLVNPLSVYLLSKLVNADSMIANVFIVEASMPVMVQSVVVTAAAEGDEPYVASGMSLTTLCCFVIIPILMQLIG